MTVAQDPEKFMERKPYGVVIEHVRHRWEGTVMERMFGDRVIRTDCGLQFVVGGHQRDHDHHEPEHSRCSGCYPQGG